MGLLGSIPIIGGAMDQIGKAYAPPPPQQQAQAPTQPQQNNNGWMSMLSKLPIFSAQGSTPPAQPSPHSSEGA